MAAPYMYMSMGLGNASGSSCSFDVPGSPIYGVLHSTRYPDHLHFGVHGGHEEYPLTAPFMQDMYSWGALDMWNPSNAIDSMNDTSYPAFQTRVESYSQASTASAESSQETPDHLAESGFFGFGEFSAQSRPHSLPEVMIPSPEALGRMSGSLRFDPASVTSIHNLQRYPGVKIPQSIPKNSRMQSHATRAYDAPPGPSRLRTIITTSPPKASLSADELDSLRKAIPAGMPLHINSLPDPPPGESPTDSPGVTWNVVLTLLLLQRDMLVDEIYEALRARFDYYRNATKSASWKHNVRHELSRYKRFTNLRDVDSGPGNGKYWRLDPSNGWGPQDPKLKKSKVAADRVSKSSPVVKRHRKTKSLRGVERPPVNAVAQGIPDVEQSSTVAFGQPQLVFDVPYHLSTPPSQRGAHVDAMPGSPSWLQPVTPQSLLNQHGNW